MHKSAHDHMALCIRKHMPNDRHYRVLDLGARLSPGQKMTHRQLLAEYDMQYVGIDVQPGNNVDIVMEKPYWIPAPSHSVDVLVSGQVFEHIPFFWVTMLEIARVLRPGGHAFITAPSRGHVHSTYDCWRYYPDGYRAMAAYSGLTLLEAYTDFPPNDRHMHDFAAIDPARSYWGDSVGVFQKPARYPHLRAAIVRGPSRWWANRIGSLENTPQPNTADDRKQVTARPG
jgi:SAM-dependent methyltransferase